MQEAVNANAPEQLVLQVEGVPVSFPFAPYPQQLRLMQTLVRGLQAGQASHSLVESPTGTGKTLCMLCAVLGKRHLMCSVNLFNQCAHSYSLVSSVRSLTVFHQCAVWTCFISVHSYSLLSSVCSLNLFHQCTV
jgi:hypothetical protein